MVIYIKDVEIPNDGRPRKALFTLKDGVPVVIVEAAKSYDDKHINVHSLVPVPDHGRLGDLEQAVIILERLSDHCGNGDMAYALNWAANTIRELPTIIPAEESK